MPCPVAVVRLAFRAAQKRKPVSLGTGCVSVSSATRTKHQPTHTQIPQQIQPTTQNRTQGKWQKWRLEKAVPPRLSLFLTIAIRNARQLFWHFHVQGRCKQTDCFSHGFSTSENILRTTRSNKRVNNPRVRSAPKLNLPFLHRGLLQKMTIFSIPGTMNLPTEIFSGSAVSADDFRSIQRCTQ